MEKRVIQDSVTPVERVAAGLEDLVRRGDKGNVIERVVNAAMEGRFVLQLPLGRPIDLSVMQKQHFGNNQL